jgi:hypothetical protein
MNKQDRDRMDEFGNKLGNLNNKVERILDALLDDKRTSKEGVISKVVQMEKDMQVIMTAYNIGKWLVAIITTIMISMLTAGINFIWFDN